MNMISDFSTGSSQKESEPIEKRAEKVIEKITWEEGIENSLSQQF